MNDWEIINNGQTAEFISDQSRKQIRPRSIQRDAPGGYNKISAVMNFPLFSFRELSFANQFRIVSFFILLVGMTTIGYFVGHRIEAGVITQTAAITALYVDSFISPRVQALASSNTLDPLESSELASILADTALGEKIVAFKIWSLDGEILVSSNPLLIGRVFLPEEDFSEAMTGTIVSAVSDLDSPENEYERQHWERLIETYAPIRADSTGEIIAISEFYQLPEDLFEEINTARQQGWLIVGVATVVLYLMFAGIVGKASNTIDSQKAELLIRVSELSQLLEKNSHLHRRLQKAASRTTAMNERLLRRIASDLHDGPVQDIALSLLRMEAIADICKKNDEKLPDGRPALDDINIVSTALETAIKDLRMMASGLRLPELSELSLPQVVERAVRDYTQKTNREVSFIQENVSASGQMAEKITLYRIVQEALNNGFRHAGEGEQVVKIKQIGDRVTVSITDTGIGFDPNRNNNHSNLGIIGMQERAELLGGSLSVKSSPGGGTQVEVAIRLEELTEYD